MIKEAEIHWDNIIKKRIKEILRKQNEILELTEELGNKNKELESIIELLEYNLEQKDCVLLLLKDKKEDG